MNNVRVRVLVPAKSICMIEKSKDILWRTYISKCIFFSISMTATKKSITGALGIRN